MDSRQAGEFTSLQFVPPNQLRPKAFTYVYPLPGEVLSRAEPIIFDVPSGKRIGVQTEPLEMEFQEGPTFEWYKDSRRIHYVFRSRGYKRAEFREVDAASGRERVVVREEAGSYIDPGENDVAIADEGAKLVWLSERDGWNHIYLYDGRTGQLVTRLTKGPWTVRHIEHVDARARVGLDVGPGAPLVAGPRGEGATARTVAPRRQASIMLRAIGS